ncbi:MFS transporter [Rhodococcoides fascians]|uniref:MFS transporter n=1 Tax=Rhodococcoides fascians TaxID=1828 RepID=UPI00068DAC96|nr:MULTISPECIES: MFS transporter [Rhodococcus]OZF06322.1 MFS transporter [Rhodococcus sp. 15-1189-1-1a]OZF21091.1 MFS transporter [Rhodococcus sp. 14-2686-1-2]
MSRIIDPVGAPPATPMRRVAIASCTGTTIEFYDFFIYGTAAALVFPKVFFPALGTAAGTVASFATFAVAFVARPLGAAIFGHFGDRIGRKKTLISTLLLMGIATVLIGCIPSASSIGIAAPIILVVLRVAQGLAVGGEWAGATLLATEYAPKEKRGLYALFPQLGPSLAFVLSSGTFLIVNLFVGETSSAFLDYGWRIPFLASALLVLIGLYVRLKVEETPMFARQAPRRGSATGPLIGVFKNQPRELLLAAGALSMMFAFFYIGTAYLTSYGTSILGLSRTAVLSLGLLAALVFAAATALAAAFSDRVGRRRMVLGSCVLSIPGGLLLFPLIDIGSPVAFFAGLTLALVVMGISYGPAGALLPEMFKTEYRYTGAGMAYAIAGVVGGGTAPTLAAELASRYGSHAVGWMLAAFGVLSLICAAFLPETRHRAMEQSGETTAPSHAAQL